ncbi:Dabb family protein [Rhodocytophaga aerolata]|uniref:Dabb family protein n=1 Tax=Rhodocytophaga aerolata TaxID=455078 RepID=A0ABT8R1M6_9BACT|nr:Dabb family protein [Rhodocytophaga aerolata]MDO1446000.1 Dabb family protein [Rhodocytophaga aerolata]
MKKILFSLLILALSIPFAMTLSSSTTQKKQPVRHVVVFKYKPSATEAQIKQVTDAFGGLKSKIPGITAFEHGINNSPEGKNLGFTHVYMLTFEDAKSRDTYLPHPEHKKFGELLGKLGIMEDVFVVDYEPK